ncbi:uncharacterized protein BJX67DRAFT_225694 [Aspergillus lucknowensis]|uniref:Fungal N-terminal domain-containing protein n=1 Tax=Aspergillus lucknowensis TaxID=176173 RepID=A0ABR4LID2_9EURO
MSASPPHFVFSTPIISYPGTKSSISGIEIGGLVLGAFPVLIHALEGYQKSLEVLRLLDTKHYQNEIHAILLEIEVQATIFRNTYLSLLHLFLDQSSIVKLLMDPGGLEQHSSTITSALRKHLGRQWETYSMLMERLRVCLPRCPQDSHRKVPSVLKPIRFGFTARHRDGLLHRIKEDNRSSRTLVEQKDSLRNLERFSDDRAPIQYYRDIQQKTAELESSVASQFTCISPQHTQNMGLYLRSCLSGSEP